VYTASLWVNCGDASASSTYAKSISRDPGSVKPVGIGPARSERVTDPIGSEVADEKAKLKLVPVQQPDSAKCGPLPEELLLVPNKAPVLSEKVTLNGRTSVGVEDRG
jgi:hypothetical protein